MVNVPGYQLEAVERHEVQQRHRVITGRPGRETPSIKTTIRGLNFFPYWRVPGSIARLDPAYHGRVETLVGNPDAIGRAVRDADLVVGARHATLGQTRADKHARASSNRRQGCRREP